VEQDAQERELGYDLFSGPTVSASGPGAGTEPYPVHEGGCAVPNLKAWAGVRVQQAGFDIIQSLSNLSKDEFVRDALIDIRHVPIKYSTIFLDQFPDVDDDLRAMLIQLSLLDSGHFVVSVVGNRTVETK
jgi:hypothetical protein